ncbi:restriction endonuclease subunit S [Sphaerospermopsis aphanizomenoides BCCUSP55]|uniref:restriction endonuclease subunit S n=1 Tax=Sphaerospermopsis aphanizomenoides TaxID=459663 RepID=UPI0019044DF0|nr:restriction endonuclease subunit S [Sphaerospermopsis aphanizomenoides]MBK1986876.1 restriction endonuclease subunit S [Sphaerospermopsis aphanizomenoides BCCUSP55]
MENKQLPEGWEIKKLDELCEIYRGGSPRPIKDFLTNEPNGINWIKISDASVSSKYIYETKEKIKQDGVKYSRLVNEGDFILSNSMSFGRPYIMRTSGCIHDGWLVLKDKSGLFDQNYLYYFLGSNTTYQQFDKLAAGSTVRNLNIDLVRSVKVLLPPLPEQKRIVAILDEAFEGIDRAISNTEKNLSNAREVFESYLNSIFSQKGEGWEEKKLREIGGKVFTGPFGSLLHKSDYVSNGIPIVNPANIEDEKIIPNFSKTVSPDTVKRLKSYVLTTNDVVVARRGEIGRCAVVTEEQSGCLCGSGSFFIKPFENVNSVFLAHLLRSEVYRNQLERLSTGATMQNLSNQSLSDLVIAMPSLDEQNQITNKIDDLRNETQRLENIYLQKIAALNELKQSILQKAFTGELTVRLRSPTTADKGITAMEETAA